MIMCGPGLDLFDHFHDIPHPLWDDIAFMCKNIQILGVSILGCMFVPYSRIIPKTTLFMIATWRTIVIVINVVGMNPVLSPITVALMNSFYAAWLIRIVTMGKIESDKIVNGEAYYWLRPIHSIWGLIQAVTLPWHPPLYETRIMVQGSSVWLVYHGVFTKREISKTDLLIRKGTKVSLGRPLTWGEVERLDSLVGKKSIPGIRDCREFII